LSFAEVSDDFLDDLLNNSVLKKRRKKQQKYGMAIFKGKKINNIKYTQ
jgi:hypothetical protein